MNSCRPFFVLPSCAAVLMESWPDSFTQRWCWRSTVFVRNIFKCWSTRRINGIIKFDMPSGSLFFRSTDWWMVRDPAFILPASPKRKHNSYIFPKASSDCGILLVDQTFIQLSLVPSIKFCRLQSHQAKGQTMFDFPLSTGKAETDVWICMESTSTVEISVWLNIWSPWQSWVDHWNHQKKYPKSQKSWVLMSYMIVNYQLMDWCEWKVIKMNQGKSTLFIQVIEIMNYGWKILHHRW